MENYDPYKADPYAEKWTGSVKDLVNKIAASDARYSAIDIYSGAHVRLNLDDDALMYIETADGDNMYDPLTTEEARETLEALRRNPKVAMDKKGCLL